ncbi:MAG TPA: carboxypeptidase regulatory-like domain-containing protein [Acidobacteriota bacterium]|nr:carboxypeptidase regulatory-like domain-containing protein [Acidobacteriota bacterium]
MHWLVLLSFAALLAGEEPQDPPSARIAAWPIGIFGTVVDVNFDPLPGVSVELRSVDSGHTHTKVTDSLGRYRFECLADGEYTLRFHLEGLLEAETRLQYRYPEALRFSQVLNLKGGGDLIGEDLLIVGVFDRVTGAPVPGAAVKIGQAEGVTDKCGRTWGASSASRVQIRISASGYEAMELTVDRQSDRRQFVRIELEWEY